MINTNFEKMQKELLYLSVEQLQTFNEKVVEMLKLKRKLQARKQKAQYIYYKSSFIRYMHD